MITSSAAGQFPSDLDALDKFDRNARPVANKELKGQLRATCGYIG